MTPYQCKAVVPCQHDNVYGSSVIGHTDAATFSTVLPANDNQGNMPQPPLQLASGPTIASRGNPHRLQLFTAPSRKDNLSTLKTTKVILMLEVRQDHNLPGATKVVIIGWACGALKYARNHTTVCVCFVHVLFFLYQQDDCMAMYVTQTSK